MLTWVQKGNVAEKPEPYLRFSTESVDVVEVAPRDSVYWTVKRVWEWAVALLLVTLSAPLVLFLAVMIKVTSRGPAFYAQTRLGFKGRHYRIYKLRTMVHNAEAKTGAVWAAKNDRRVTGLGRLLRDTHLDEVPQLINVLRGEMSLIGPRPERPEIARQIELDLPTYRGRLAMRPGITGLAQMLVPADDPNEPAAVGVRKKLAHDLYYVRKASLMVDVRIAMATPCYFLASAVEAVRKSMVKSYGAEVEKEMELKMDESGSDEQHDEQESDERVTAG